MVENKKKSVNEKFLLLFLKDRLGYLFMKPRKLAFLFLAVFASALMSACSSTDDGRADKGFNCLGIVKYEPASFVPSNEYSIVVRTKDLFGSSLPSGDRTSFLWESIVLQDY